MYEFSHAGFWVRWGSLDRTAKRLLIASCAASVTSIIPIASWLSALSYRLGYMAGSGGRAYPGPAPLLAPWQVWWLIGFGTLAAILWWRFSLRQDELFNRVQNWALAMSGALTALCLVIWSLFAQSGAIGPVAALPAFGLYIGSLLAFWYIAYRRWAA